MGATVARSERTPAILTACVELLTEVGFERLTIDAVAARAKASKATIYRRWRNKNDLAADALRYCSNTESLAVVDTRDLHADLFGLLQTVRNQLADSWPLLSGLIHAMQRDPELARLMRAEIGRSKAALRALLEHRLAEAGGRLPDTELAQDLIPGQIVARLLIGEPVDDAYLRRFLDGVVHPLLLADMAVHARTEALS